MADLRIVDASEIPTNSITGQEKLPTGGSGNYSISLDSVADYTKTKKDLVDTTTVDTKVNGVRQELDAHIEDLLNPHKVTKGQIGLGNVDNTADLDKPVSNSTQAAIISAVTPKADKTYVDNQLTFKANKADVYTKLETYTKQESSDLVNNSISTALTPVNASLDLAKRGVANRYDSSLIYNSGERVVLTNGDIVKSTVDGNVNDPNVDMTGWDYSKDKKYDNIFDLVSSVDILKEGQKITAKGFEYQVALSSTEDFDLQTASGSKLYVIPTLNQLDLESFGAIADYTGTPQYDGNDSTRVTATDNSPAFIKWIKALNRTGAEGVFKGHFGLKTPHYLADAITLNRDLKITGFGKDKSILDFIHEDATGNVYQDYADAKLLLRLKGNGFNLDWSHFKIKATTNNNVIGDKTALASVYFGKVWGVGLTSISNSYATGFNKITLNDVHTDHFNYRGFTFQYATKVTLNDCSGFYNNGSGYWGELIKHYEINGGEYAFNGFKDSPGTGYGVTGSYGIDLMITNGGNFHNNYRKGLDSHGCLTFVCKNSDFKDNVYGHIGLPLSSEKMTEPRTIVIDDSNNFSQGKTSESLFWLREIYNTWYTNGFTSYGHTLLDMAIAQTNTAKCEFIFEGNKVRGGYRGLDIMKGAQYTAYIRFSSAVSKTTIRNNDIDVPQMGLFTSDISEEYGLQLFGLPDTPSSTYFLDNNHIVADFPTKRTISGVDKFGAIFTGSPQAKWNIGINVISMQDQYLLGSVGNSNPLAWSGDYRLNMTQNSIKANRELIDGDTKWFGRTRNLTDDKSYFDSNAFTVNGITYRMDKPQGGKSSRYSRNLTAYVAGATICNVIFDKTGTIEAKIKVFMWDGAFSGELLFSMPYGTGTITGTNTLVTATVNNAYIDTDGVTKVSVVLKAVGAISANSLLVDVDCISRVTTYGVEKIAWS